MHTPTRSATVIGAGYVGLVTAVGLAGIGQQVRLVEAAPRRLDALRQGRSPQSRGRSPGRFRCRGRGGPADDPSIPAGQSGSCSCASVPRSATMASATSDRSTRCSPSSRPVSAHPTSSSSGAPSSAGPGRLSSRPGCRSAGPSRTRSSSARHGGRRLRQPDTPRHRAFRTPFSRPRRRALPVRAARRAAAHRRRRSGRGHQMPPTPSSPSSCRSRRGGQPVRGGRGGRR